MVGSKRIQDYPLKRYARVRNILGYGGAPASYYLPNTDYNYK